MAFILGYIVGVWLIYALLALIFKHKIGLVVSAALYIFIGILNVISENGVISLISSIIAICIIGFVPPIQVRSKRKKEWKNRRKQKSEQENCVIDDSGNDIENDFTEGNAMEEGVIDNDISVNDGETDSNKTF